MSLNSGPALSYTPKTACATGAWSIEFNLKTLGTLGPPLSSFLHNLNRERRSSTKSALNHCPYKEAINANDDYNGQQTIQSLPGTTSRERNGLSRRDTPVPKEAVSPTLACSLLDVSH
jgi:hypothetical protein